MSFGGRAIDHLDVTRIHCHQPVEKFLPNASLRPAIEAIVHRRRRAIDRGTVLPPAARLENMDDP